jgi:hypothetical protein
MKLVLKALELLWPSVVLAGIWLVVALAALWYARSTRRPIFLWSGLGALLLMVGEVISPLRVALHYLRGTPIPGGTAGKVEMLVGAYKYQIAVEALGAILLLVGIGLEVSRARRRARSNSAQPAGPVNPGGAPVGSGAAPGYGVPAMPAGATRSGAGFGTARPSVRTGQWEGPDVPLPPSGAMSGHTLPTMQAPQAEQPCPRCQVMLSVDAQFCGNCGLQLLPTGPLSLSPELPPYPQGRTSARASGARSNEEFL